MVSRFEKRLNDLGIRHILARVTRPQTNGKLERVHVEMQRKLCLFSDVAGQPGTCLVNPPHIKTNLVARFVRWHNHERPHMSLDADIEETRAMAFKRKIPSLGSNVTDE